jgi:hypothetical protein
LGDSVRARAQTPFRVGLLTILASIAAVACGPHVEVKGEAGAVVVDTQFLGEYPSPVRHVRLSDSHGIVWEIVAKNKTPEMHWLKLRLGENPAALKDYDDYRTVVPAIGQSFVVAPDVRYSIEVWGKRPWSTRRAFVIRSTSHG